MNTAEKCEAILKEIVRLCNEKEAEDPTAPVISFGPDWGGNALTIYFGAKFEDHTHVGASDAPWERFVDRLYDFMLEGKGLSLQIPLSDIKA